MAKPFNQIIDLTVNGQGWFTRRGAVCKIVLYVSCIVCNQFVSFLLFVFFFSCRVLMVTLNSFHMISEGRVGIGACRRLCLLGCTQFALCVYIEMVYIVCKYINTVLLDSQAFRPVTMVDSFFYNLYFVLFRCLKQFVFNFVGYVIMFTV